MKIEDLFLQYFENYAYARCRSALHMRANFERYFSELRGKEACSIRPYDVQRWHNRLALDHGEPTANRSLQLLRTLYNFGDKWEILDCRNPARAVRKFKEQSRERFVTEQEMPRLLRAIEHHGTIWTKDLFLMCLYTAQRLSNVCSMQWGDISFEESVWTIPKGDFKAGRSHSVPLVDEALAILSRRLNNGSPFVFPGRRNNQTHIDYPYNGWRKVLKAANISDLHPHDLRRTHATYQVSAGEPVPVIAKMLGHSDFKATTAIYARVPLSVVKGAMQGAVKRMIQ